MRKEPTEAEKVLWQALRRKGVEGMRFRSQRVIGPYIVDFCSLEHRVILEVQGAHHVADDVAAYDEERTRYLETYGFRVLRVGNEAVMSDLAGVLSEIASANTPFLPASFPSAEV